MAETKSRILYILKYLWHNTDAEHYATTGDILTYLKENGISCDRKTIPGDIAKLCDIGIDIEEERSRENRYSLSSHLFTLPEVKLLIDAVESSKFITAKKSSELANKLSQMTSVYQPERLKRNIYISQRVKPMNEQIYYLVDNINTAINQGKQISFLYRRMGTAVLTVYQTTPQSVIPQSADKWKAEYIRSKALITSQCGM